MTHHRRPIACMLTAALLVVASAANAQSPASSAPASAGEPGTITWGEWWVNEWGKDVVDGLISDFESKNPNITVNVVDFPNADGETKLSAAAQTPGQFDVYATEEAWLYGLNKLGYAENLDTWLEQDPDFANSLADLTPLKTGGDTRGLCLYLIPYQFAYNVDTFESKGLEPPTNWDEFVSVEQSLLDATNNKYGMSLALQSSAFAVLRYFDFRLAQEGGKLVDDEGNPAFNSPEGVAALEWWKKFYDMNLVVPGSMSEVEAAQLEYFATGQTASTINGPYILTQAQQTNPDINVAYAPPWKATTGGYSWACSGIAMAANSPNKDAAWKFIKYLYSDPVALKMTPLVRLPWATKAGLASLEGSDDPILKYIPQMASQDPTHNVVLPVLPEGTKLFDALGLAIQQTLNGDKDAKTALDEAAATWQQVIAGAQ
jgi:ABC-type glycerol-3-phosphate transport system substrate-binding protein